jgi:hypothetical protein
MDRLTIERNLAQVERDLRAASEDIALQHEALKDLTRHGDDTTEAVRSIGILEHTHLVFWCGRRERRDRVGVATPPAPHRPPDAPSAAYLVRPLLQPVHSTS